MARLIDADALIAWIKGSQQMTSKMKCVIAKIETMPDAVEVVRGEWVELGQNKDGTHNICCGACGVGKFKSRGHARSYYTRHKFKYCPNCGAKMKGADDE